MKKLLLCLSLFIALGNSIDAQETNRWKQIDEKQATLSGERTIIPSKYKTYRIDEASLKANLFAAPSEKNTTLINSATVIELPMPDGQLEKFKVVESPVMAPELAAQFPDIKTFNVQSMGQRPFYGKLDWNDFGFHALLRSPAGDIFIDPFCRNNKADYIVYYAADFKKDAAQTAPEIGTIESPKPDKKKVETAAGSEKSVQTMICAGSSLRTYRLAVSCTGEYAVAATGVSSPSLSQILSAVVTTVNRVDGVYETEVAVKLVLIGDETSLLFSNASSDPFTGNNDGSILIDESQTVIDGYVGNSVYDIGHTFSTGGGGLAYVGCVCDPSFKARGITGNYHPVGDPYDIDYVAHEMGHQFGGQHTFASNTGSCSGNTNPSTEVEPGSGITIMAYAGICGYNDLEPHSIPYFHTISFNQIMDYTTNGDGSTCPVVTPTGNSIPAVSTTASYTIPVSTPFVLTGSATDADGDSLTYQWEEIDSGNENDWNSGAAPYFRSYNPDTLPSRMFPKQSVLMSASWTDTLGEYFPSNQQTLKFRLIVRDNKIGGGGICYSGTNVVISGNNPFTVASPNTSDISWISGNTQTVVWDVNGTNGSPYGCTNVNILLSIDGGYTYTTLLANTPNDGIETVTVPIYPSEENNCRVKVECATSIFFDFSDESFTILPVNSGVHNAEKANFVITASPNPFGNEFNLNVSGLNKELTSLKMYNVLGDVVAVDAFTGSEKINKKYDFSTLSKSVYFVEINNVNQNKRIKLVKQ